MARRMINNIPQIRKAQGLRVSDLHVRILQRTGETITYQTLHKLASDQAQGQVLPKRTALGNIHLIAQVLGVTFDDLIRTEEI